MIAAVFFLIVLPLCIMKFLEKWFSCQLDSTDRSLIYFFLFIFFIAYLAILGIKTPFGSFQTWIHEFEIRLRSRLKGNKDKPPSPDS